jgi:putative DNA primase/helicase
MTPATAIDRAEGLTTRAHRLQVYRHAKDALEMARGLLSIKGTEWDANPWVLGVANGVVDLLTGDLRGTRADDYIRTVAPVEWYGLDTPAPRWQQFVEEIFDDDVRSGPGALPAPPLGYGLVGQVVEHVLPILWGEEGRNGKDTLLGALRSHTGCPVWSRLQ